MQDIPKLLPVCQSIPAVVLRNNALSTASPRRRHKEAEVKAGQVQLQVTILGCQGVHVHPGLKLGDHLQGRRQCWW
jgi:hypothetical protein